MTVTMPWCESCSRFLDQPAPGEPEVCTTCGRPFAPPGSEAGAPWHFKLLVAATAAYLAFRALQGVLWLVARL